jgi:hypothetical protein
VSIIDFFLFSLHVFLVKKTSMLSLRITEELEESLEKVSSLSGVASATIARLAIEQFLEKVSKERMISFPMDKPAISIADVLTIQNPDKTTIVTLSKASGSNIASGNTGTISQSIIHQGAARRRAKKQPSKI